MLSSSDDLARGVAFGAYVVRERIGRGGMATVYRAEHRLLEKPVALKVMDRSLLETPAGLQRFLLEGRAAAAIKHPNVVDITDVGVHEGLPYLVMELLTGEDLDSHLRKHRLLDSSDAVRIALPVVAALNAAHGSGVVHRDIKPSNIFLSVGPDDQLVPKVLDFGISKMSFDRAVIERMPTPRNQIIGTPQYLPPEALQGPGAMGPLSDQYSLGVVLYQCVTGRTPFAGDTLLALLEALARGAFDPPRAVQPSVSAGLERVILRALNPEPNARFPTIRDMGRALIELAAERTQTVWGQSFATPARARVPTPSGAERAGPRGPWPSSEQLATLALHTQPLHTQPPWRRLAIGAALLATGALAATFVPSLLPEPEAWGEPVQMTPVQMATGGGAPGAAPAQPAAAAATTVPASSEPSSRVLGLMPAPGNSAATNAEVARSADLPSAAREAATASRPSASRSDRAARVRRALAARARPAARTSKARAPKKPKTSEAPLPMPASAQTPEAAQPPEPTFDSAPPVPDPPPSAPVIGANGAPILD